MFVNNVIKRIIFYNIIYKIIFSYNNYNIKINKVNIILNIIIKSFIINN